MLTSIHSIAKGFGAKLLLALLVLSFAVWGIGDMVRAPAGNQTLATVGKATISREEFRRNLSVETERVRNMMGANYSPELLKTLQLPQQVLQRMTSQLLMTQEIDALGLRVSDDDVARILRNNSAFHDDKGNFDKEVLRRRLNASGLSEKSYIDQLRRQVAIELVIGVLSAQTPVYEVAVETLYLSRNQQRNVSLYILDTSLVGAIPDPDKKQLEEFYKQHASLFAVPEYRTLSYMSFTGDDAKKDVTVTEDDIKAAYEERIDEFRHEEKRTIEQLLLSDETKAKEAKKLSDAGKPFAEIASALGAINKNALSLGSIDRKSMIDGADGVFDLEVNAVSEPVKSPFGWHVFRVVSIDPAGVAPYDQVKANLEKDIKQQKLDDAVGKLVTQVEDMLASGTGFAETAKEFGFKLSKLPKMNASGKAPDGSEVKLPDLEKFMDVGFKLDEKSESPVTFSKGGMYYVVYAEEVFPEHTSPFAEVQDKATQAWKKEQREKRLAETVSNMAEKSAHKDELFKFIKQHSLEPNTANSVKRSDKKVAGYEIPGGMMADIFVRKEGDATLAYQLKPDSYAIAVVNKIIPAKLPADAKQREEEFEPIRKELANNMKNELMDGYMNYLSQKYSVHIEESAFDTALDE